MNPPSRVNPSPSAQPSTALGDRSQHVNGWRPALVALDIDGTLVDFDNVLPDAVRTAVLRVVDAGVPVVLATGRSWVSTRPIHEALGLPPGPAVCSNGSVTVSYPPFELTSVVTFDPGPAIRMLTQRSPTSRIAVEVIGEGYRLNRHFPDGELQGAMRIESVDDLCAEPVTRVIVRDPEADQDEFRAMATELGLHEVEYSVGYSQWLDIAPPGVTKASALQRVCDDLGISPANVLALGDGNNDLEMLTWAGRGVALGDAGPELQAAADAVTQPFAEGGTVKELARWF